LQQAAGCRIGDDYPAPIIDHQQAVRAARAAVAAIRKTDGFRAEAGRVYQQLGSRKRQTLRRKTGARQTEKPQSQLRLF
jgi:deoxyribodipyrimidine photo-lyase